MAFRTALVSLNTSTAVIVVDAQAGDADVEIRSPGALDFYVGGSDLTASNGVKIEDGRFQTRVRPGDELWGLSADGSGFSVRTIIRSA